MKQVIVMCTLYIPEGQIDELLEYEYAELVEGCLNDKLQQHGFPAVAQIECEAEHDIP
jgi:hypothetical protein